MKKDWEAKTLGQVCEFRRGLTYKKTDEVLLSENIVLRANNINLENFTLDFSDLKYINSEVPVKEIKKLKKNSILICAASGSKKHLGKVAFVDKDYPYAFGGFMGLLVPDERVVFPQYLFNLLISQDFKFHLNSLMDGAGINNLKFSLIEDFQLLLPPISEQKRIVKILDEKFETIEKLKNTTEEQLLSVKELFESRLKGVFDIYRCSVTTLNEISENLDGKRIPITKSVRTSGNIPYYGASGVVDYVEDYIFDEDLLLISEDGANLLARTYPIAFSVSGKTWVNNHAHVLRFKQPYTQRFIEYYINSISIAEYVTGAAQPKLNQRLLNLIPVPNPELDKQEQIVKELDKLSEKTKKLETIFRQKLADIEELKKSYLNEAFSGKL